jgi:very-short-patch-repair endonuclease
MPTKEELLNNLTVKQLKQLAKDNKVSLVSEGLFFDDVASTKDEIIEILLDSDKITKDKIQLNIANADINQRVNPPGVSSKSPFKKENTENTRYEEGQKSKQYCNVCKIPISEKVYSYSVSNYGKPLCMSHQKIVVPETYSCAVCERTLTELVYNFSTSRLGAPLCMNHQKTVTPQAIKLSNALKNLDVKHQLEYDDGFKHVDIAIEYAKLYLELDGSQHAYSPKQMCTDDERDKHSQREGFTTKRIPNIWVDRDVDRLAYSIAVLANKRYKEILENENKISITGIVKSVFNKMSETLENFE